MNSQALPDTNLLSQSDVDRIDSLTRSIERLAVQGDIEGVNALRNAVAAILGMTLAPLTGIRRTG